VSLHRKEAQLYLAAINTICN